MPNGKTIGIIIFVSIFGSIIVLSKVSDFLKAAEPPSKDAKTAEEDPDELGGDINDPFGDTYVDDSIEDIDADGSHTEGGSGYASVVTLNPVRRDVAHGAAGGDE